MAAEMKSDHHGSSTGLITRDFLGVGGGDDGCCSSSSSSSCSGVELDLDLHVPLGWEKRLDLKSGKVYLQRCNPANTPSDQTSFADRLSARLHDLNSLQRTSSTASVKPTRILLQQPSLDLKLISSCLPSNNYTSVCTLDKVKSALDRAEQSQSSPSTSLTSRKGCMMPSVVGSQTKSSPSPSNSSSLSVKEKEDEEEKVSPRWLSKGSDQSELLVATACPGCFLYVLISKNDPKCPKCNSVLQLPTVMTKKPNIDLNISM